MKKANMNKINFEITVSEETARKLKRAGFPQKSDKVFSFSCGRDEDKVYLPTLSEILERCGNKFENLERIEWPDRNVFFRAFMTDEAYDIYSIKYPCVKECCGYGSGESMEEAAADLWLMLNEVKTKTKKKNEK